MYASFPPAVSLSGTLQAREWYVNREKKQNKNKNGQFIYNVRFLREGTRNVYFRLLTHKW
jgi:hypothetical protein